jgi:hypothetical protein
MTPHVDALKSGSDGKRPITPVLAGAGPETAQNKNPVKLSSDIITEELDRVDGLYAKVTCTY